MTAGGPQMERGEERLKAYVSRCIAGTKFGVESVEEIVSREEDGFGTAAVQVFATNLAIHRMGDNDGEAALRTMDERRGLPQLIAAASKHVYARIDVDLEGRLFVAGERVR